jgi:hypothetical protein
VELGLEPQLAQSHRAKGRRSTQRGTSTELE